jgi:C4-dicarboxylate-specific signal transduction histidine kinase
MSRFNPLLWTTSHGIRKYAIAVLSVTTALILAQWPVLQLGAAPVSLFLCAVMLSAWFGGIAPALLAIVLSDLAFYYYFLPPMHSLSAKPHEIPRFIVFTLSKLVVALLTAAQRSATNSLRLARDELKETVQELRTTNEALQTESRERKHAEEALRQTQADLAHASRVTTMGELTASLAHEVNQPIAAAVTDANTCLRWLAGDTPNLEEAREAAMRTVKDGRRAAEIVSRIRLLFKKGPPQRELVDVNEVIREMIVLLRSELTRYSVSIRTDLAPDLPQIMGDRVQLQQVLMNLMINGIDAMRDVDGTRELAIQSQPAETEQLMVSVSDTGLGLPRERADQIFDAFFTTKAHGTGMGLSISRSIVESHEGRLWAAANSPRGASFFITLPTQGEVHE